MQNQRPQSLALTVSVSRVNKGRVWVKVPSLWKTFEADNYNGSYQTKDSGCLVLNYFLVLDSPPYISFLFPGRPSSSQQPDPQTRSHAHPPWLISRERRRLAWAHWPSYRPPGPRRGAGLPRGEGMDGWISLRSLISQSSFYREDGCE